MSETKIHHHYCLIISLLKTQKFLHLISIYWVVVTVAINIKLTINHLYFILISEMHIFTNKGTNLYFFLSLGWYRNGP